ncbi:MAG: hypothetical protein Kow0090_21290 [Myxococcota bacterium]
MSRIKSIEEFSSFRKIIRGEKGNGAPCIVICAGTGGQASGSNDIIRIIKRYILENNLVDKISLRITGCLGFCEKDPFIVIEPSHSLYPRLKIDDIPRIIEAAIRGEEVEELLYREPGSQERFHSQFDIPFFKNQMRTILGNNERLDPIRILDYIKIGGYEALEKVLRLNDRQWIVDEVKKSGLRGRGGAGFLTGKKWELAASANSPDGEKYIVCNGDEGDPGAYMDRSVLEGNPHSILEGMIIGGIAIGAKNGVVYVRTEYPLAIKHLIIAIRQARSFGLLGKDILGTGVDFDVEIVRGAGAFVCGEETALIKSVEGKMGEPRQRPPYPIQKGIFGKPTCINNVETLANIPIIISKGADEYAKVGTAGNTGTKIFSLVGKVKNTGLVEVPLGTPLSKVIYDIGGGAPGKGRIKAVQTGGPSGGCIPASLFDTPIDYESLSKVGSIMGSGGMIVMDANTCMVDVAKYFMNFLKDESCGKCFTCRKGTQRMWEILDDISKGEATLTHLSLLEELANIVKDTTMCGLGQTAANPVLSTLKYFRNEYESHIINKRCESFVCKELVGAPCQSACPVNTEAWRYVAHIERGEYEDAYRVIREANPFPSVCARVCNHPCEEQCRVGKSGGKPVAIRALKRFITDKIKPTSYKPLRVYEGGKKSVVKAAVIGAGPAGLTAAHCLSLKGYKITVFDSASEPGGMLLLGIPSYRLPRDVIKREIESLIDGNITLKMNTALGKDITIDGLLKEGYKAIFLAIGAHKSKRLEIPGEDAEGVYPSIKFLSEFNANGKSLAKGRVGVVGGGNSAIDAARTAIRQKGVESVTIYYRRTREEMPAFAEEIEAALEEGVKLEILASPVKIHKKGKRIKALELSRNELGAFDSSGRRRPVPIKGSEYKVELDTLIVGISETSDTESIARASENEIEISPNETVKVDHATLCTSKDGVFAGGDLIRGPSTVIEAIADGKLAAVMIDRYLKSEPLRQPLKPRIPIIYIEPSKTAQENERASDRAEPPKMPEKERVRGFVEVELSFNKRDAVKEARRCLRCDLEFTAPKEESETQINASKGK